jgi:hypothetical protein
MMTVCTLEGGMARERLNTWLGWFLDVLFGVFTWQLIIVC